MEQSQHDGNRSMTEIWEK